MTSPDREPGPVAAAARRGRPVRALFLFAGLFGFWLILAGAVDPQRLLAGAAVAGAITLLWYRRLESGPTGADVPTLMLLVRPGFLRYVLRLGIEILRSNWTMARVVLSREMPISPHFVLVRTRLQHNLTRVIYATSITLTPGTLSVSLDGDDLIVHAISRDAAEGVRGWPVEDRVRELERAWDPGLPPRTPAGATGR